MQASRQFVREDQLRFAHLSGDFNPMHMDALAARRTQAGAPVVHGIHALLWLIDAIARNNPALPPIASMKVRFARMVYVGENVRALITQQDETSFHAEVLVGELPAVIVTAALGKKLQSVAMPEEAKNAPLLVPAQPANLFIEEIMPCFGRLALPEEKALTALFPDAARYLGARRVAALACSSCLVGMVMPGLHSIYGGLTFDICADHEDKNVAFQVTAIDPRFHLVRQSMWGGGIAAKLETFVRQPPVRQATLEEIIPHISRSEFAGMTALIVGGSRGLGELTAKVIVAGGGKVIITYAQGKSDAEKLAGEIKAQGGRCEIMAYNVFDDAEVQLSVLPEIPSYIYYFATPPLTSRQPDIFPAFYVRGFERLMRAVLRKNQGQAHAFYPSSVAIDEQTAGMAEYAKAKADGEQLCTKLMTEAPNLRIVVSRLPRMLTDLTATIHPVETAEPLEVMLPIIRDVQKS